MADTDQAGTSGGRDAALVTDLRDAMERGVSSNEGVPSAGRRSRRPRPPKLYRIGEVIEYSDVSRQTIHNYTTMGLLRESKWTAGGHRLYDDSVFERLDTIADLKSQNRSLQDIREYFTLRDAV